MAKLSGITTPSLTFDEGAAPSTPSSADVILYAKADGLLYSKDDAGTETLVSGGAGGGGAGSWTTWTPTVTQSGAVSVTVNYAVYMEVGDITFWRLRLTVTANGSSGNDIIIGGQPAELQDVNAGQTAGVTVPGNCIIGTGIVKDEGTAYYSALVFAQAAQDWRLARTNQTGSVSAHIGTSPSFALSSANSDSIIAEGVVRTA